jgi:hypothetical protein
VPANPVDRALQADKGLRRDWPDDLPWSRDDQVQALVEGWSMALFGHAPPCVMVAQSMGDDLFKSDEHVLMHVRSRAALGSELHQRALSLHIAGKLAHH